MIGTKELRPLLRKQASSRNASGAFPLFEIGMNPYDILGVRELAAYSGVELDEMAQSEQIQQLFSLWGTQKAFRFNAGKLRESTPNLSMRTSLA